MGESAALWVDHLLPKVPYRQYVLSFNSSLAIRLGYDAQLLSRVCRLLSHELSRFLRYRIKREHKLATCKRLHAGIITVVQRFRSDPGLYVHLHCLVTDGIFEQVDEGSPVFHALSILKDDDLVDVLRRCHRRLAKHLDSLQTGTSAPKLAMRRRLNVSAFGMNLHAATTVDGRDRKRLERLCRYLLRPPFAANYVQWLPDGRVRLQLPRKAASVDMSPQQFLAKLVALVPPPHIHLVRYGGIFANAHRLRRSISPRPQHGGSPEALQLPLFDIQGKPLPALSNLEPDPNRPKRIGWAKLLAHVFAIDIERCECGGRSVSGAIHNGSS